MRKKLPQIHIITTANWPKFSHVYRYKVWATSHTSLITFGECVLKTICSALIFQFPLKEACCYCCCHSSSLHHSRAALLAFKNTFSTPSSLPSWDPQFDCCNWYGVECNETTNYVTGLDIASVNLNGTIPPAITKLKHLQHLRLHELPNLAGEIPPEIGQLPLLTYLVISWTNISGPVPHFLSKLKNLRYLVLSFNRLSGLIPPFLPTLAYLYVVDLSRNQLTGPIPDSFGRVSSTGLVS